MTIALIFGGAGVPAKRGRPPGFRLAKTYARVGSTGALVVLIIALFLVLVGAAPVLAQEQITNFQSSTVLKTDGSVDVTEVIVVNAEGQAIRHGIYRDIPTVLTNPDNSVLHSGLHVLSVERDGTAEPYAIGGIANGTRVRIGGADTIVTPGAHRYEIHYTMTRMGRVFPDHDELYWNATGNYWNFPILKASAAITLPEGAVISRLAAYTGRPGATEQAATITKTSDNTAIFRSTRVLMPGEGLSVVAAFQSGILLTPSGASAAGFWLSDHRGPIAGLVSLFLVLGYNFFAWFRVGRDPKKGTVIPLFHPPKALSPGLVHYIHNFGFKQKGWTAVTAGIFSLGVKGAVSIDNPDDKLKVTATGKKLDGDLPAEEAELAEYFDNAGTTYVDKKTGPSLDALRGAVVQLIATGNKGKYFRLNIGHIVLSIALTLACQGAMAGLGVLPDAVIGALFIIGFASVFIAIFTVVFTPKKVLMGGSLFSKIFYLVWAGIIGVVVLGNLGSFAFDFHFDVASVIAIAIIPITILFCVLMRAATPIGRKVMDEIDGFIMYLDTAEKHRLNLVGEPVLTVARFEAILPFAIALGVEKPWSKKFETALANNQIAGVAPGAYAPLWYTGHSFNSGNLATGIAAIGTGMAAAMIAAQPVQSSSSGFSGGGSGGGGGGGGGGGW